MKDNFSLIVMAIASATVAWAFWHVLGEYAATTLLIVALITTIADNMRLRRIVRRIFADATPEARDSSTGK